MSRSTKLRRDIALVLASSMTATSIVVAQEPPGSGNRVETVVVTGSRIARPELDVNVPVAVLERDQLTAQGMENFADIVTTLPQFAPSFGTSRAQSTFSGAIFSGLNLSNLRNLGDTRSVVLINGRRVPPGTPHTNAVDFNTIPSANIERLEVTTGGASAIYGADAVAGVVNIITRKDFEGIEIGASYGTSEEGDNENPSGYLFMGTEVGERGHAQLLVQYDYQGEVSCADRYLCAEDFAWTSPTAPPVRGPRAYSGVPPQGRFFIGSLASGFTQRNGSFADASGNPIPFVTATDGYNRNARRTLAIPTRREMLAAEGEYEIASGVQLFVELNYGASRTNAPFEGHPFQSSTDLFAGVLEPSIPADNPFIPAVLRAQIPATQEEISWWQRFDQFGLRGARNERQTHRYVLGFRGDFGSIAGFGSDWSWEVSYMYGSTTLDGTAGGSVGTDRLYHGLRVEPDPANPGQYRCIDPGARAIGCVPINPFQPYTSAQIDYLTIETGHRGRSILKDGLAYLSGNLFELPAGPLQVAVGAEVRELSGFVNYDEAINRGLTTGNQIGDTDRAIIKTQEAYIETVVPLLKDLPAIEHLELEAAYRYSDTEEIDTYDTWKYGLNWSPIEGLRLRAMRARSVRAPVPDDLSGVGQTFGGVTDPCIASNRDPVGNPVLEANCLADGIPANYNPPLTTIQNVSGFVGGNPDVKPEVGTTLTFGVTYVPSFLPSLELSVDRFDIEIEGIITEVDRALKADLCYNSAVRQFCSDITRGTDPAVPGANYVLRAIDAQVENVARFDVSGFDIQARYALALGPYGNLMFDAVATIYDKADFVPLPNGDVIDLLGAAGGSTDLQGYLRRQGRLDLRYSIGGFGALWNIRHIGRADMSVAAAEAGFPEIGSHTYHNARFSYGFEEFAGFRRTEMYVGVTNVFDKQPPFFATNQSGTQALDTIPAYYDVFGRSYYAGATVRF